MILLNGQPINPTIFPDRTSQVWHIGALLTPNVSVVWNFEDECELFHLAQLKCLIDKTVHSGPMKRFATLHIPYLPYARQDKDVSDDTTFALKVFADILNSQYWDQVTMFDVHSSCATDLINNSVNIEPNLQFANQYDYVVFPDKGALLRYKHLIQRSVVGLKQRDQATGRITSYSLSYNGEENVKLTNADSILVVDDLCDGGATFNILAKSLDEIGATDRHLYVSHGLFSKGLIELRQNYNKIITTDTCFSHVFTDPQGLDIAARQSHNWFVIRRYVRDGSLVILPSKV